MAATNFDARNWDRSITLLPATSKLCSLSPIVKNTSFELNHPATKQLLEPRNTREENTSDPESNSAPLQGDIGIDKQRRSYQTYILQQLQIDTGSNNHQGSTRTRQRSSSRLPESGHLDATRLLATCKKMQFDRFGVQMTLRSVETPENLICALGIARQHLSRVSQRKPSSKLWKLTPVGVRQE